MSNLNNEIKYLRPFTKFCCTIGNIPSSYMASLSYEEQLLWLCNYLEKTVIPTINNNSEVVEEIQKLFNQLKDYVDNYFKNLDVQEEINRKLDEMAESGELLEIISQYLNLNCLLVFDTIEDMKKANNLVNGSKCKTLGFFEKNDGGSALYTITDENLNANDTNIFDLNNNLKAILINYSNYISSKTLGVKGDGINDDTEKIQNAINYCSKNNIELIFNNCENYKLNNKLFLHSNLKLNGNNQKFLFDKEILILNSENENEIEKLNNIIIKNFQFIGKQNGRLKFGLLNTENILFENNIFDNCSSNHHIFDLGGGKNITIKNNIFKNIGSNVINDQGEIIQLDIAYREGLPYWTNENSTLYDNSCCENIYILQNKFYNKENCGSNPIGSHATALNNYHKNIFIEKNYFEDFSYASIKLIRYVNCFIKENTFIAKNLNTNNNGNFIRIAPGYETKEGTSYFYPSKNIHIEKNNFEYENNDLTAVCIYVAGSTHNDINYNHDEIFITENIFNGSYDSTHAGGNFINVLYVDSITIKGNIIKKAKNGIFTSGIVKEILIALNKFISCRTPSSISSANHYTYDLNIIMNNDFLVENILDSSNYLKLNLDSEEGITKSLNGNFLQTFENSFTRNGNIVNLKCAFNFSEPFSNSSDTRFLYFENPKLRPKKTIIGVGYLGTGAYSPKHLCMFYITNSGSIYIKNDSGTPYTHLFIDTSYSVD